MHLVQITPGAGRMYCGNCLRDNALVAAWQRLGHDVLMVPIYLPLTLDEPDRSAGTPIFFSGVNVYLDHKFPRFRSASNRLRRWLSIPSLLRHIGRFAARTRPEQVADLTLSMLRGEDGNQARDLEELVGWLRNGIHPDAICLSNALLLGMARRLKEVIRTKIICFIAGEEGFIDAMPEPLRGQVWETLIDRARDIELFIAPSRYYARRLAERLLIATDRLRVIPPGIDLAGYPTAFRPDRKDLIGQSPVLGYFTRMCPAKGLDTLVDAYIRLKTSRQPVDLKLKIGGGCGPSDARFVRTLQQRLRGQGLLGDVEFHPNLDHKAKIQFLESLTLFSVPARSDAFGLYLLEAMAAGVPLVQPPIGAFPEVIETTGAGLLSDADTPEALADAIRRLLDNPALGVQLGRNGWEAARARYAVDIVARLHIESIHPEPLVA